VGDRAASQQSQNSARVLTGVWARVGATVRSPRRALHDLRPHLPRLAHGYLDVTETKEPRRISRHIPRDIMFKVARRDDYRCQKCQQPVPDDQIEFDHIIPHAKVGPTTVANIRLLCRTCNRKKGASTDELLQGPPGGC
jgi:5-methylcytosine-specific restriction endonuclease McrA